MLCLKNVFCLYINVSEINMEIGYVNNKSTDRQVAELIDNILDAVLALSPG